MNNFFRNMPTATKNLLILNVILWLGAMLLKGRGIDLNYLLGMHYFQSDAFQPYQIITSMFMHSDQGLGHIFFNMFALVMFGGTLERVWGAKRFLFFYFVTGLGAALLHTTVQYIEIQSVISQLVEVTGDTPAAIIEFINGRGLEVVQMGKYYPDDPLLTQAIYMFHGTIVGASGAIYGLLLAFGMLFPNTELMLLFFPVPIKAKYFIPGLIALELFLGYQNFAWDNIAHFAHIGGALFGFILVMIWKRNRNTFY